jgi:hypothetical protein
VASLARARTQAQWPFAAIPFLFALQQCAEGCIWLGMPHGGSWAWQQAPVYAFLVFAQIIWPTWIPLSLYPIAHADRRSLLSAMTVLGLCVSLTLAWCMIDYGAHAEIIGHHVAYELPYPPLVIAVCGLLYGVVTIGPPLMTGIPRVWWLGVGIGISYLGAAICYEYFVLSVWCYFSALLSVFVYVIVGETRGIPGRSPSTALRSDYDRSASPSASP